MSLSYDVGARAPRAAGLPAWLQQRSSPFAQLLSASPAGRRSAAPGPKPDLQEIMALLPVPGRPRIGGKRRRAVFESVGRQPGTKALGSVGGGSAASGHPALNCKPVVHTWRTVPHSGRMLVQAGWNGLEFAGVLRGCD